MSSFATNICGDKRFFPTGNALYNNTVIGSLANFDGTGPYPPSGTDPTGIKNGRPVVVGSYPSNNFGLYDMHGNLAEFCLDVMTFNTLPTYPGGSVTNPPAATGIVNFVVIRGGSWGSAGLQCRSACRASTSAAGGRSNFQSIGFRVVLAPVSGP